MAIIWERLITMHKKQLHKHVRLDDTVSCDK